MTFDLGLGLPPTLTVGVSTKPLVVTGQALVQIPGLFSGTNGQASFEALPMMVLVPPTRVF